ncbi:hypothetical protein BDV28DRAFT_128094 [Aspergillus coremiiformis]|uniref:F-box domain-containing protein n=1 Tax=Aspergillus coremiiformis TaxID=138285 RepID=A0A5N6ZE20_9EURO|nr:hypothetical protein BDV28DRAFT_128094 [Aspergillus coremiiformis]
MAMERAQIDRRHSEKAYENSMIRAASYHRRDFDLAVIKTNPSDHEQVRSSMLRTTGAPSVNLGRLECLPLEIIFEICLLLDLESLFRFRQVNRRAQQIISAVHGYRETITYALEVLCIVLRTKTAPYFTIYDLFKVLCTRDCLLCGSFGGFVFLPSLMRCCFSCIKEDCLPAIMSVADAKRLIKWSATRLPKSIPVFKTLPGIYSMDETSQKRRMQIVTKEHIARISRCLINEEAQPTRQKKAAVLRYMVTTALPHLDITSGDIQSGICCSGCQVALEEAMRTTGIEVSALGLRDKVYSRDSFLEHFRQCRKAQELFTLSKKGVDIAKISESVRRGGYFNERGVIMSFGR